MAEHGDTTVADVLAAYERGERSFVGLEVAWADFRGRDLRGARFERSSLEVAAFDGAELADAWIVDTDLDEASFDGADLSHARLDYARFRGASLRRSRLADAVLFSVELRGADLTESDLGGAHLEASSFTEAALDGVVLGGTAFLDVDVSPFCDAAGLVHAGPSYVDLRTVSRSHRHPGIKRFLVECGVPPLVAEYTITAAEAEGDALASLMRSTFISYGGPDEAFARRLYDALRAHGVTTFFFPETARLGRRIGDEVHSRIQEHDRVILVCSRASLDRPGVRNEIQETLDREARDGGATYLLPITLDDYVLTGWTDPLAARVRDRVVGDFRATLTEDALFDRAMSRLLTALRKEAG